MGKCSSVVTLFFSKKTLTKTDRCAGALLWRRNRLLFLHFSGHFLLTSSIRRRTNLWDWNTPQAAIPENYTTEFRELSEGTGIGTCLSHSTVSYIFVILWNRNKYRSVLAYVKGTVRDAGCECVEHIGLISGRTGSVIYIVNNLVGQGSQLYYLRCWWQVKTLHGLPLCSLVLCKHQRMRAICSIKLSL